MVLQDLEVLLHLAIVLFDLLVDVVCGSCHIFLGSKSLQIWLVLTHKLLQGQLKLVHLLSRLLVHHGFVFTDQALELLCE